MLIPTLILITFIVLRLFREMVEKFMSLKVSWNDSIISWKLIEINARKKLPARNIPSPETQSCPDFRSNRLRRSIDLIFFSLAIDRSSRGCRTVTVTPPSTTWTCRTPKIRRCRTSSPSPNASTSDSAPSSSSKTNSPPEVPIMEVRLG